MRKTRVSFATPFVLVVSACGSGYKSGHNPPGPHSPPGMTAEECQAIQPGSDCNADAHCEIPRDDGCGLVGYKCEDLKWKEQMVLCNPPPPQTPELSPSGS